MSYAWSLFPRQLVTKATYHDILLVTCCKSNLSYASHYLHLYTFICGKGNMLCDIAGGPFEIKINFLLLLVVKSVFYEQYLEIDGKSINARESLIGNQEWTIRRNWQHLIHKLLRSEVTYIWQLLCCEDKNIMYNVQDWNCSPGYMWGLAFNAHVESTGVTTSFSLKGRFCSKN